MKAHIVLMEGPEWSEVIGVFVDPVDPGFATPAAERAKKLVDDLKAGKEEKRIPRNYRDRVSMRLSEFVVKAVRVE